MPSIPARFDGTATLSLDHPALAVPMTANLSIGLAFSEDLWSVTIAQIPEFTKTVETRVGVNTTILRITHAWANYFPEAALRHPNWPSGAFVDQPVPERTLELHLLGRLEHSISLAPIADVDSSFSFDSRSAGPPPSVWARIDAAGDVSLWDDGRFETGILSLAPQAKTRYTLMIAGRIVPPPGVTPVPPPLQPGLTVVPDVLGMERSAASAEIRSADLVPRFTGDGGARTDVSLQLPGAGAVVERGTTVQLRMARRD